MEPTLCERCKGEGLTGQGDQPWLKQGHVETCSNCGGSGSIATPSEEAPAETAEAPENVEQVEQPEATDTDPAETAPVDNPEAEASATIDGTEAAS